MCGGPFFLDDQQIGTAQRLRREAPEPLLASVRTVLNLAPDDPIAIWSNAHAEGCGIPVGNAMKAAALIHLAGTSGDTQLSPREILLNVAGLTAT